MARRFLATIGVTVALLTNTVYASNACHKLSMSYILADQDAPEEPGDKLYIAEEDEKCPVLMETTGYCTGTHGSHGDKMEEGFCAAAPEMYGDLVLVYQAIKQEDGSYDLGEFINCLEIKDCGYGYPTYQGKSKVRQDERSEGTIEAGLHLDIYKSDLAGCKEWMRLTGGKVFAIVIEGKG